MAALCLGFAAAQAAACDIGSAPYSGSFGITPANPQGFLGSLTVQNAVYDATGELYVVESPPRARCRPGSARPAGRRRS